MAQQPQQNFVDRSGPVLASAWLNEVDLKRLQLAWTAGGLITGLELPKYTAAQQARSNTITLADDTYLVWPAMPVGVYRIRGLMQPQGSVSGGQGLKFKINAAGGLFGTSYLTVTGIANNAQLGAVFYDPSSSVVQVPTISTALFDFISFEAILGTAAVGNISLQWSQYSFNANATILNANSWMSVTPFA